MVSEKNFLMHRTYLAPTDRDVLVGKVKVKENHLIAFGEDRADTMGISGKEADKYPNTFGDTIIGVVGNNPSGWKKISIATILTEKTIGHVEYSYEIIK